MAVKLIPDTAPHRDWPNGLELPVSRPERPKRYGPDLARVQATLNHFGFPCGPVDGIYWVKTESATLMFQAAFAGGRARLPNLAIDGLPGPLTWRALEQLPYLAPHFKVSEVRSNGNGHAYVRRELLHALERLRRKVGRPIVLASGYRDPKHNRRVGGARYSSHMYGTAADIVSPRIHQRRVRDLDIFSGVGFRQSDGTVSHVDLRHLNRVVTRADDAPPYPGTNATPANPARWTYPT